MDERNELLRVIRRSRRKLNIAGLLEYIICALACAGVIAAVLEAVSLWIPFYYVHRCAWAMIVIAAAAAVIVAFIRRIGMHEAAKRLDTFGLKERTQTAYEMLDDEGALAEMVRKDATKQLLERIEKKQIRIRVLPPARHLAAAGVSLMLALLLAFVPSPARDRATLDHTIRQEAKEKQKEVEKMIEAIDKVDAKELSEEQKALLDELRESLDRSSKELADADSRQALDAAEHKLGFKYAQTSQNLMELAAQMSQEQKDAIQKAAQMAEAAAAANGQQVASAGNNTPGGTASADGSASGNSSGSDSSGNNSNGNNSNGNSSNGNNSDGNSSDGNSSNGNSGNGSGGGSGNNGSGAGGDGSGSGSGSGSGGSGSGSGSGRGTGSANNAHDYVSVPNATGNDDNLTGQKTGNENGESYRAQNGMVWEGDHVSLDSVISDYTKSAYEGISSGRYPSGMEDVIKDYFKNLNR